MKWTNNAMSDEEDSPFEKVPGCSLHPFTPGRSPTFVPHFGQDWKQTQSTRPHITQVYTLDYIQTKCHQLVWLRRWQESISRLIWCPGPSCRLASISSRQWRDALKDICWATSCFSLENAFAVFFQHNTEVLVFNIFLPPSFPFFTKYLLM